MLAEVNGNLLRNNDYVRLYHHYILKSLASKRSQKYWKYMANRKGGANGKLEGLQVKEVLINN